MKTTVFNLIILDESGSMTQMTNQTISGCNETLNIIRSNAKTHAETMNSFVSIYAFQDGGPIRSRYLVKNANPADVQNITHNDYKPWGNTPLLDAVGSTLTELKTIAATHEDSTGIITIMTDGYENSSTRYSWQDIAALISQFREMGWTINLVGTNIDVNAMAARMNICTENTMEYSQTEEGTKKMWTDFSDSIDRRYDDEANIHPDFDYESKIKARKSASKKFFTK